MVEIFNRDENIGMAWVPGTSIIRKELKICQNQGKSSLEQQVGKAQSITIRLEG